MAEVNSRTLHARVPFDGYDRDHAESSIRVALNDLEQRAFALHRDIFWSTLEIEIDRSIIEDTKLTGGGSVIENAQVWVSAVGVER